MDSKLRDNVLNELFKIPEVREVSEVTGTFDVLVTMNARSLDENASVDLGKNRSCRRSSKNRNFYRNEKDCP